MRNTLKLGIFLVSLLSIVCFYLLVAGKPAFLKREKHYFYVKFDYISGLDVGAPVRLAGMKIGEVEDLELEGDKVVVKLRTRYLPKKDSRISINSLGLIGEKYVEMTLGSKEASHIKDGDILHGINPVNVEEILFRTERVVEMIYSSTLTLEKLLLEEEKIKRLLASSVAVADSLKRIIEEDSVLLKESILKFNSLLTEVKGMIEYSRSKADKIAKNFEKSASKVNQVLAKLEITAEELKELIKRVKGGEGVLPKLLYDKNLADKLSTTIDDLKILVGELREHPEYILRGKKKKK